jgi:hypothetical protein
MGKSAELYFPQHLRIAAGALWRCRQLVQLEFIVIEFKQFKFILEQLQFFEQLVIQFVRRYFRL